MTRLPVLVNTKTNEKWELKGTTNSIGRHPENDIIISDEYASARHATICWEDGAWWLKDLNSSNGTKLNDELVTEPCKLAPGNRIKVGRTVFLIE